MNAPRLQKNKAPRSLHQRRAIECAICVCTRARWRHMMNMQTAAHYCSINLISPRRDALAFNLKRSKQRLSPFDRSSLCFRNKPADACACFSTAPNTLYANFGKTALARYSKFMHRAAQELNARGHNTHGRMLPTQEGGFVCGCALAAPTFYLFIIVGINGLLNWNERSIARGCLSESGSDSKDAKRKKPLLLWILRPWRPSMPLCLQNGQL